MDGGLGVARGISSAAELLSLLRYDADDGRFVWTSGRLAGRVSGSTNGQGYLNIKINGRVYLAHRLAWLAATGEWPAAEIDHINGVKSDNRACNLRSATRHQNAQNVLRRGAGANKGATKIKSGWMASIKAGGKSFYLGVYPTAEAAHEAYCSAARNLHGQFARPA